MRLRSSWPSGPSEVEDKHVYPSNRAAAASRENVDHSSPQDPERRRKKLKRSVRESDQVEKPKQRQEKRRTKKGKQEQKKQEPIRQHVQGEAVQQPKGTGTGQWRRQRKNQKRTTRANQQRNDGIMAASLGLTSLAKAYVMIPREQHRPQTDRRARVQFLDLDEDVRYIIYTMLLTPEYDATKERKYCWPQILQTSKQVNREATQILYNTDFQIGIHTGSPNHIGSQVKMTMDGYCGIFKAMHRDVFSCPPGGWPQHLLKIRRLMLTITFHDDIFGYVDEDDGSDNFEGYEGNHLLYGLSTFLSLNHSLRHMTIRWNDETIVGAMHPPNVSEYLYPIMALYNSPTPPKLEIHGFAEQTVQTLLQDPTSFPAFRSRNLGKKYRELKAECTHIRSLMQYRSAWLERLSKASDNLRGLMSEKGLITRLKHELIERAIDKFDTLLNVGSRGYRLSYIWNMMLKAQKLIQSVDEDQRARASRRQVVNQEPIDFWEFVDEMRLDYGDEVQDWSFCEPRIDEDLLRPLVLASERRVRSSRWHAESESEFGSGW